MSQNTGKPSTEFVIKNSLFKFNDIVIIILGLFISLVSINSKEINGYIVSFISITIYVIYKTIKRIEDRSNKIVINKTGITLYENNITIIWSDIEYAYIKCHPEGSGKSTQFIDYLHIVTAEEEIKISMADYSFDIKSIENAINRFSGKEISKYTDILRDKSENIIADNSDIVAKLFANYYKLAKNTTIILIVFTIIVFGCLQIALDFPYTFAFGLTSSFGMSYLLAIIFEKIFKKDRYIKNLTKKEYKEFEKIYNKGYKMDYSKKEKILSIAIIILSVIGVFAISYYLSK
jgi:hypothetical protein